MKKHTPTNQELAAILEQIADLLEIQHANTYRVQAYRAGSRFIRQYEPSIAGIVQAGEGDSLRELPFIGERLSGLIREYVRTGRSQLLQRLKGQVTPEELFEQVPGVGPGLAERIVRELDIRTLEELEQSAYDGRLARVEGIGEKRLMNIRLSLAAMLSGFARQRDISARTAIKAPALLRPPVELLLEVDREYRQKARDRQLRRIAPKRFNPENRAWLPILHTDRSGWSFTALYSNTVRAHDLGMVKDWVVIFYEQNDQEGQATVVTETHGPMTGKRVVRGREHECLALLNEELV